MTVLKLSSVYVFCADTRPKTAYKTHLWNLCITLYLSFFMIDLDISFQLWYNGIIKEAPPQEKNNMEGTPMGHIVGLYTRFG